MSAAPLLTVAPARTASRLLLLETIRRNQTREVDRRKVCGEPFRAADCPAEPARDVQTRLVVDDRSRIERHTKDPTSSPLGRSDGSNEKSWAL